jgi:transcriptional regulator NrdR family protein
MIHCPICKSNTKVLEVRGSQRRRECTLGHRFNTHEITELEAPDRGMISIKKDEYKAFLDVMKVAKRNVHLMLGEAKCKLKL